MNAYVQMCETVVEKYVMDDTITDHFLELLANRLKNVMTQSEIKNIFDTFSRYIDHNYELDVNFKHRLKFKLTRARLYFCE